MTESLNFDGECEKSRVVPRRSPNLMFFEPPEGKLPHENDISHYFRSFVKFFRVSWTCVFLLSKSSTCLSVLVLAKCST